ncbi:MAG TPA: 3-dehydroquinate synthase family protein [Candidatus Cybelea sp.]|nr:3-dehydroquinate synthase family protein [Candidatus Cybelea sp.]
MTAEGILNDDLGYPIVVGERLEHTLKAFARKHDRPSAVLCDADRRVRAIARDVAGALGAPTVLAFPLGERRKRLATVEKILDAMNSAAVERTGLVVGVGGGVASDIFGFACAIYMRGVRYAHVATSLVAMVDAAIGGKTGVDLRAGKNLAGCFRDPVAVFCDVAALASLPVRGVREGLAEIVKAAVIEGGDFFDALEELAPHPFSRWPWTSVIAEAVKVKTMTVADDRLEAGMRELLNLGHTFAHAIELASGYRTPHGAAVAVGLRAAGLLALRTGRFSEAEHLRVLALLTLLRLPLRTEIEPDAILDAMRGDKKRRGGRLRFVLPRAIGDVEYGVQCPERSVRAVIARLREEPERFRARR